jgi:replicative DNA helicase
LLRHASDLAQVAHEGGENLSEKSTQIGSLLMGRRFAINGKDPDTMQALKTQIQEWANDPLRPGEVRGIATGFRSVDTMLGGLSPSLFICAATTSMGKTAFACQTAVNVAKAGHRVLYLTKEMSTEQVLTRMACAESKIDWLRIQAGTLTGEEIGRLMKAIDVISDLPLVIDDTCYNIMDVSAIINTQEHRSSLLVVDYLGLFVPREVEHRSLKLGCASQTLLAISRQEKCTVLALHQIGRKVADRKDKRPQLSDLQWSGMLEQDADIVGFLYREELNTQLASGAANSKGREMELIVRKNRLTGRLGKSLLYFGEFAELHDLANRKDRMAQEEEPPELGLIPWD